MTDLSRDLRRALETTVKAARDAAELAAADALRRLGVFEQRRPEHLTEPRNTIRKRLRAHAKSLGDRLDAADGTALKRLTEAAAYVQWHRLLFARFLVERGLLRDESGIVVSLADCREEAAMGGTGDEWSIASAHAARQLPGVFPPDDAVETLVLAPEHAKALRDHLRKLDAAVFAADDSLGWTYQFWRIAEKKAVNDSQVKIGAAELPAVTQLFTEPYMVRFLLHNTLGAWWAGKVLSVQPEVARNGTNEIALRAACALPGYEWEYLRFVREDEIWRPAAGTYPGWPNHAAGITLLDPCCGSGHFLTEALAAIAALRSAEESLPPAQAVTLALRDNVHGLEIDGRCVQIAAFALALTAWRIGGAGTTLPVPHVAWVGAPPPLPKPEFVALANGDADLRRGLEALHDLFAQAPLLGSLIEVTGGDLINPMRIARIEESIATLVERMRGSEPERAEGALAARGMADAAAILARRFVIQATNVPFLGRGKQEPALATFLAARFESAKSDLANAMITRMRALAAPGGTVAAVTPQNWLFLGSYRKMREALLEQASFSLVAPLGPRCFETISGEVVSVAIVAMTTTRPHPQSRFAGLDANGAPDPTGKAAVLTKGEVQVLEQAGQLKNPDARIAVEERSEHRLLSHYAHGVHGLGSKDAPMFFRQFWEQPLPAADWELLQTTVDRACDFGGFQQAVFWQNAQGILHERGRRGEAVLAGGMAWGRVGVLVNQMGDLPACLYVGNVFDKNAAVILPNDVAHLPAIWSFCTSPEFNREVRKVDQALKVTNNTLVKIPFDLKYWQSVGAKKYPTGLPEPYSDDPT